MSLAVFFPLVFPGGTACGNKFALNGVMYTADGLTKKIQALLTLRVSLGHRHKSIFHVVFFFIFFISSNLLSVISYPVDLSDYSENVSPAGSGQLQLQFAR